MNAFVCLPWCILVIQIALDVIHGTWHIQLLFCICCPFCFVFLCLFACMYSIDPDHIRWESIVPCSEPGHEEGCFVICLFFCHLFVCLFVKYWSRSHWMGICRAMLRARTSSRMSPRCRFVSATSTLSDFYFRFCDIWDNSYLSLKATSTEHQHKFKVLPTNFIFHTIWVFEHCSAVGSVFLWPIKSAMNMLGARTKALMTWAPQKRVPF